MSAVNDYEIRQRQLLYTQALLNGDDQAAFQIINQMVLARPPLGDVYLNLITPLWSVSVSFGVTEKSAWV